MKSFVDIKRVKVFAWIGLAFIALSVLGNLVRHYDEFWIRVVNDIWRDIYLTVLNFILFEYTLPYIKPTWSRLLAGGLFIGMHIMLYSFGLTAWRFFGMGVGIYTPIPATDPFLAVVETQLGYSIGSILFFGLVKHVYDHIKLKQSAQQLRIEKQEAELNYLKSQTNPHFLFNTLNNIYSLARDKSDLAPESVLRLSKILRYMLYETSGAYVTIEQELKIITDYIALEKLRYDESLYVNFNYDIEEMKQALPPLLLIPLVENAFKHGVSEARDRPFVDIHLSVNHRQLHFTVKNSHESLGQGPVKENIGLSNLRRQLELLYKQYNLSLLQGKSVFTATLQINLSSHVKNQVHHNRR